MRRAEAPHWPTRVTERSIYADGRPTGRLFAVQKGVLVFRGSGTEQNMTAFDTLLWVLAVVLVVAGVVSLVRRQILWGIVLIVVGLLVGPGGVSIFT